MHKLLILFFNYFKKLKNVTELVESRVTSLKIFFGTETENFRSLVPTTCSQCA